mgnify:FL=1
MMKKNRGFTLIELLAAMVILGLLMAIALPTVLGLFSKNTNKVYVNDALKLVSQAEYKIRAASTTVERPDDGDCIIMSLKYLDNGDFDEAPNKGEYVDNKSFVVIKNTGNDLEYSVTLVENVKGGGYRGVKLTLASKLNKSDAVKYVVDFKDSDLVSVADDEKMYPQYATGINNTDLGSNYVNGVLKVYDKNGLRDNTTATDSLAPKIVKASISSASNKDFNSLDAKLSLTVSDKDTEFNLLKVKYKIYYDGETENYPEINSSCSSSADSTISGCFDWKTKEATFSKNFDFSSKLSYTDENKSTLKMYLIVYDPDGNYDSRIISYSIHKNRAPVINNFSVGSMNSSYNISKARVRMDITDDIDDVSSLKYCLTEDKNNGCKKDSEFKLYKTDANGFIPYTFMCNNSACLPDGSTKTLHVFVKDSSGLISTKETQYNIYNNQPPHFKDSNSKIKLNPIWQKKGQNGSLMDSLEFKLDTSMIVDDLTEHDNLRVRLQEVDVNGNVVSGGQNFDNPKSSDKTYKLSELGGVTFKFSGNYLGSSVRYLSATFIDEYGKKFELTKKSGRLISYNNVYHNNIPVISEFNVSSVGTACDNCDSSKGGSLNTTIKMTVSDDIDSTSKLEYKICTKSANSTQKCGEYTQYDASDRSDKQINYTIKSPSDYQAGTSATDVNFTLYVKDSDGAESKKTFTYKLYSNNPPVINIKGVYSKDQPYNTNNAEIKFTVSDDFNSQSGTYKVCAKKKGSTDASYKCTDVYSLSGKYGTEIVSSINGIAASDVSKGTVYQVKVEAYDGLNTSSEVKDYELYKDEAPVINSFKLTEKSFDNESKYITFRLDFDVKDPFDKYTICVTDNKDSCTNYSSKIYTGGYKIENHLVKDKSGALHQEIKDDYEIKFDGTYDEDTPVKLYLYVKDNHNKVSKAEAIYDACYSGVTGNSATATYGNTSNKYSFNDRAENPGVRINRNNCSGNCYYISNEPVYEEYEDENGEIQVKYDENGEPIQKRDEKGNVITELSSVTPSHRRTQLIEYSKNESINVFGAYKMTSTYYSKKVANKVCTTKKIDVNLNCSFYTCYKNKNGDMSQKVIGIVWYKYNKPVTKEYDGDTYDCNGYYRGYNSSYVKVKNNDDGTESKMVILTYNKTKYCDALVEKEDGPYAFKNSSDPYIRGNDYDKPNVSIVEES